MMDTTGIGDSVRVSVTRHFPFTTGQIIFLLILLIILLFVWIKIHTEKQKIKEVKKDEERINV